MPTLKFTTDELATERWSPFVRWEDWYSISTLGQVRRDVPGRGLCRAGMILRPQVGRAGYLHVSLSAPSRHETIMIHHAVTEAFLGPLPDGLERNHINGNRQDNRLVNLEYVTHSANILHSRRVLGKCIGELNNKATITTTTAIAIKQRFRDDPRANAYAIAREFGASINAVYGIKYGNAWRHLGD